MRNATQPTRATGGARNGHWAGCPPGTTRGGGATAARLVVLALAYTGCTARSEEVASFARLLGRSVKVAQYALSKCNTSYADLPQIQADLRCVEARVALQTAEMALDFVATRSQATRGSLEKLGDFMDDARAKANGNPTMVKDTCPQEDFMAALKILTDPARAGGALLNTTVHTAQAPLWYRTFSNTKWCGTNPPTHFWPISTRPKPLIINAGEGSTGTRFLHCVMKLAGLKSQHLAVDMLGEDETKLEGCNPSCTAGWDRYDYVSDTPVPYALWTLMRTHPTALVTLSLRDPEQWRHNRINKHLDDNAGEWRQAGPCRPPDFNLKHADAPLGFVVYNAWALCLARRQGNPILLFNLFDEPSPSVLSRVMDFLKQNSYPLAVNAEKLASITAECAKNHA